MSPFATSALQAKHAYVAALLAGAAVVAGAQTAAATDKPAGPPPSDGPGRGGMMMHRPDSAKMQAVMAKRQAEMKAKLKLAPEQESSWTTFAAAVTPPAQGDGGHRNMERPDRIKMRAEMEKLTTPERIEKMRAMRDQRHTAMMAVQTQREEATKTFYASLTPDQKKIFDSEAFKMMAHHRGGPGGREHGNGPKG